MRLYNGKMNRILTWVIIVAILSGILPTGVRAAEAGTKLNGINNYVVELSADPSTSARPDQAPDGFGKAASDGRVWADKSVSVNANGTQFDVTLSALAQEYVRTSTGVVRARAAADVALILDVSGSMTSARFTNMKNAVNKAIELIMAANPRNRVGVYYYGGSSGVLFPLASYSTPQTGDGSVAEDRYMTSSGQSITRKAGLTKKNLTGGSETTTDQTQNYISGTGTQMGVYTGIKDLITAVSGTTLDTTKDTERVPYVMLLTDGDANEAYPNWYNSPPSGTKSTSGATVAALSILTAAKMKDELKTAYSALSGGKDVVWFNIAFALNEDDNMATALLKPSKLATATTTNLKSVYTQLTTLTGSADTAYKKYGINGTPGYLYSTDYIYFIAENDLIKVDKAMGDLGKLVEEATQEKVLPIDQSSEFGAPMNLIVTDVLGAGMELKTTPKMGSVTATLKTEVGTVKTYEFANLDTTVEYDSATRELKWIIPPAELPLIMFSNRKTPVPGTYSNASLAPAQLTYTVGLKGSYASGTFYSNEYVDTTATARFKPNADNPYYYMSITASDNQINSTPKVIGSGGMAAFVSKSSNITGTAAYSYEYEWSDKVFVTKLGNNGKLAPKLKIDVAPVSGTVTAGGKVTYNITVTNLTGSAISNVVVNNTLPGGLTFVSGSMKEDSVAKTSATFPYTINSVPAGGSVVLTFEAAVPGGAAGGTEYSNDVATITSVGGTSLPTSASVTSDKVTVAATFTATVTTKLDGAGYDDQTVALWQDGASKYTLTPSGSVHSKSGIAAGTYDIYINGVNSGVQLSNTEASKTINYYSVSFYDGAQKLTVPAAQTVISGGKAVLPTAPTKAGNTFDKWVTANGGNTAFDFDAAITTSKNAYAKWTANVYDITFVIDPVKGKSTGNTSPEVAYGATPTEPSVTAKPGYEFTGWDKTIGAVTGDTTYTAQFDLTSYAITYNLGGGSVEGSNPSSYTVVSPEITLNNPTRTGYTFGGWTGTELNEPTTTVTISQGSTEARSYTATWVPSTDTAYTVNHYQAAVDGQYSDAPTVESLKGTTGEATNAQAKTYTGFTAQTFAQETIEADGSTVVDIYYKRNLYDISFMIDPGMGTVTDNSVLKVVYEATPTAPNVTAKPGYEFTGWDKPIGAVTGDTTYTAQFDLTSYAITYNLGGGSVEGSNPSSYTVISSAITLNNPTRTGYTFGGWTGTDLSEPTTAVTIAQGSTDARSYTAIWTATATAVTLDDNGGSGGSGNVTATYDQPMPTATAPSREGYTFVGYFDAQTGSGTKYYDSDMSSAQNWDKLTESVTLYAVWTELGLVTLQYAANNAAYGTVSTTNQSLNPEIGTATGSVATAKPGYRFVEWQDTAGSTVGTKAVFVPHKAAGQYTDATYTAVFAIEVYNIAYTLDGGKTVVSNPSTYTVESGDFTLTNPTRLGYTFAGWTGTGLTEPTFNVTVAQGSTGDLSYTATWEAVPAETEYIVIGTVVDENDDELPGATVKIVRGDTQYGDTTITDAAGQFTIEGVPAGIYNLTISLGENTAIIEITIGGSTKVVQLGKVIFPYNASSLLKLKGNDTPPIVIDNLQPEAEQYLLQDYGNVGFAKVELVIEKVDQSTIDAGQLEAIGLIDTKAKNERLTIGIYLDMTIEKFYRVLEADTWNSEGLIDQTNGLIKILIPIPAELHGKSGYTIYRYHGNAVNVINSVPNADGEYLVLDNTNWTLTLYARNFSVYAIAYETPITPVPPFIGATTNTITFNGDGGTTGTTTQAVIVGNLITKPADPTRTGFTFVGWYKPDGTEWNFDTDKVYADLTLTAKWIAAKKEIPALDKVNHFAYMQGYPDKTFAPKRNMTRAEVAVMFARLLVEKMDVDKAYPSTFKDVDPTHWYANAIGYMEQYGIITGYADGTFRPNAPITRAEFAAIASRFDVLITGEPVAFTDVASTYWARDYISFAAAKGWIKGYPDATFKPENNITRAEVVTLVNRMLERYSDSSYVDSNKSKLNQYVDLTNAHWAYYDIMEATNRHDYTKASSSETWTSNTK